MILDAGVNVHNTSEVLFHLCANTDPQRDSLLTRGPADVLDHAMSQIAVGGKLGIDATNRAKDEGRKIVAVGTTSVRTLESAIREGRFNAGRRETDIFITPGFEFKAVDKLLTNFHLPESTLMSNGRPGSFAVSVWNSLP